MPPSNLEADRTCKSERAKGLEFDTRLTVVGSRLQPGQPAPDFTLDYLDPADAAIHEVRLQDSAGRVRQLNVVNSLDTPVCHVDTRAWEQLRGDLSPDVAFYTISLDLPFALSRRQAAEGVTHPLLSSHRSEQFGQDDGVLLKEWRLLQRGMFMIEDDGLIVHAEYVPDQMQEPDYQAALDAVRRVTA